MVVDISVLNLSLDTKCARTKLDELMLRTRRIFYLPLPTCISDILDNSHTVRHCRRRITYLVDECRGTTEIWRRIDNVGVVRGVGIRAVAVILGPVGCFSATDR